MAGIGSILGQLGTSGSITAPTALSVTVGSALSTTVDSRGIYDVCPLNALRGLMFSHGTAAMWHAVAGVRYRTGLLAPSAAQTLASAGSGAKATATLTLASNPSDGKSFTVGHPSRARKITFKTTLDTSGTFVGSQVKRGANLAATIANAEALVNATGTHGTEYFNDEQAKNKTSSAYKFTDSGGADVSVTATTGTTIVFTCGTYGTLGNSYVASCTIDAELTGFGTAGLMTGGVAGSGTDPGIGSFRYARAFYRSGDGAQSGVSDAATISKSNPGNVNQTNFVDPATRDAATHDRWFRTQNGALQFFRGGEIAIGTAEPYVDAVSDDTLIGAFQLLYDPTIYRTYAAGYPQVVKYVCNFKDRVFGVGADIAADYTNGTASVTTASASVTLSSAAHPKEDWIGRSFQVSGDAQYYTILEVVESTRVITLHGAYRGATNATASFTVSDKRDPFEVFWSEPGLPNNWPITNSVKGVTSKDTRGGTGIKALWDGVAVWTWTGLWKLEGSAGAGFRIAPVSEGMGAFCNQAIQVVQGVCYWIGPDGIFAWGGDGMPENLSNPQASSGRGIQGTIQRINIAAASQVVSDYNPSKKRLTWYVPVDGEERNRLAIVYDLQTGAFAADPCEEVTSATSIPAPDGQYHTVLGDANGCLWETDIGNSDGAYGFETVTTVTGYATATKTVTCSAASYPTSGSGLAGLPVAKVDAAGEVEFAKIASNTGTTLVLSSPFTTAPAVGDKVIPGAIVLDIQTGRFDFQSGDILKKLVWVVTLFQPSSGGRLFIAAGIDSNDPTVRSTDYADLTATDGEYLAWFRRGKFTRAVIRFLDPVPGHDLNMIGFRTKIGSV